MSPQKTATARIAADAETDPPATDRGRAPHGERPSVVAPTGEGAAPAVKAEPAAPVAPAPHPHRPKRTRRRLVLPAIALAILAAVGWYGYDWWTTGRFQVSTDDAYVEGDIATITPKVTGYVASVEAVANARVKAGDVLIRLDDGDYRNALDQAEAKIATERLSLDRLDAEIVGAEAALAEATAQKAVAVAAERGARLAQTRAAGLAAKDVGTTASLDAADVALDQAKANVVGADAAIAAAEANVHILEAQRREAEGSVRSLELARDKAARDLSFTVVRAPYDGVVGNLSVQAGDLVSPGQKTMALVPVDRLYVEANFKETQIADLAVGAKVAIRVDALDGEPMVGTVTSISPASGAVFSLLPPQNATGNFTKVIQRVPVRIALPEDVLASGRLRAGLSVIVDVDSRTGTPAPAHG